MQRRAIRRTDYGTSGTVDFPTGVVYVFNPNYVELTLNDYTGIVVLTVSDSQNTYSIDVSLYNGSAKCYISKLLQLLFDDYVSVRSKEVTIALETSDGHSIASSTVTALWAHVDLGMKFGYYLPFVYDGVSMPPSVRDVIWFKNLPFKVSLFRETQEYKLYSMRDKTNYDGIYDPLLVRPGMLGMPIWGGKTGIFELDPAANYSNTNKVLEYVVMKDRQVNKFPSISSGWEGDSGSTVVYDTTEYGIKDAQGDLYSPVMYIPAGQTLCFSFDDNNEQVDVIFAWITNNNYECSSDIYENGESVTVQKEGSVVTRDGRSRAYYLFTTTADAYLTVNIPFSNYIYRPQLEYSNSPSVFHVPGNIFNQFEANFDMVFPEPTELAYIVRLHVCNDKVGVYLRWIDHYGFWQYYLFVKGSRTSKNSPDKNAINLDYVSNGVHHQAQRVIAVENTDTIKCCAVNMRKEILAYVETIFKSTHIDMYIGKDFSGNEMWKPVNIEKGSVSIAAEKGLYDYEFSITLPDSVTQTL
jgi:hypothetical protein